MAQNVYDNEDFFKEYAQLERSIKGLAGAAEWPAIRALLPDLHGRSILDLGCGYGWFCRFAIESGASKVLGVDISEKMLEKAKTFAGSSAITYKRADLESLELERESFNLVYSSLALHYVENLNKLMEEVYKSLLPGGSLVISIEHPIYTAPSNPRWYVDYADNKTWPINGYQIEGPRSTDWLAKGVIKQHRTIGTYLNMLIAIGFTICHVEEWGPTDEQIQSNPEWKVERERPMFLLISARK